MSAESTFKCSSGFGEDCCVAGFRNVGVVGDGERSTP